MKIFITEVTVIDGGKYCVAAWDESAKKMVRLLPAGENWTDSQLDQYDVAPGISFDVKSSGVKATGVYPHKTEDWPIDLPTMTLVDAGPATWFGKGAPPTASTLSDAFEGHLQNKDEWNNIKQGCFVSEGTKTCSLSALRIPARSLEFHESSFNGNASLRAYLTDKDAKFDIKVSSKSLREIYQSDGLVAVRKRLKNKSPLHIRVGLARAWDDQPDKCFIMLNGVQW